MLDITINTAAAMPATVKAIENSDKLNGSNFAAMAQPVAEALGSLQRTRAALVGQFFASGDDGTGHGSQVDFFNTTTFANSAAVKVTGGGDPAPAHNDRRSATEARNVGVL